MFYFEDFGAETQIASSIYDAVWQHLSWAGIAHPMPRSVIAESSESTSEARQLPALLSHVPAFEHLTQPERVELAAQMHVRTVRRGEHLIVQGETGESLFVVRDGMFDIHVEHDGEDRIVKRLFPGDYAGEASLLTGAPRNATLEAVSLAVVYEIDKAHFEPFLRARPDMAELLAAGLVTRNAERDATSAQTNGARKKALAQMAAQIRSFFRHAERE